MGHMLKDKRGIWRQDGGESHSPEDALLEREHDDPAAIAREAAQEGISVESYVRMRTNRKLLLLLKRMVRDGNAESAAEMQRDPKKAEYMDALLQAHINGLLGLSLELDPVPPEPGKRGGAPKGNQNAAKRPKELAPVPPEPRNRGGAPKGNQNAAKRRRKTTPH